MGRHHYAIHSPLPRWADRLQCVFLQPNPQRIFYTSTRPQDNRGLLVPRCRGAESDLRQRRKGLWRAGNGLDIVRQPGCKTKFETRADSIRLLQWWRVSRFLLVLGPVACADM